MHCHFPKAGQPRTQSTTATRGAQQALLRLGLIGFSIVVAAPARSQPDFSSRPLLASGDVVEGLGTIGVGDIQPQGIDGYGRVLVKGQLSTGAEGLFWADNNRVSAFWTATEPGTDPVRIGSAITTSTGVVVATGLSGTNVTTAHVIGLYRIHVGTPEPLVHLGDIEYHGLHPCGIGSFAMSDEGVLAFTALFAASGSPCDDSATARIYVLTRGTLQDLDTTLPTGETPNPRLLGITADGAPLVDMPDAGLVVEIKNGQSLPLVSDNVVGSLGLRLGAIRGSGGNARGDVLFWASDENSNFAAYRTYGGRIVRVVGVGDTAPNGQIITSIDQAPLLLGDGGDAALVVGWQEGSDAATGTLRVSASGTMSLARGARPAGINASGSVALLESDPSPVVTRWDGESESRLIAVGDPAPGGGVFATGGIENVTCLAADGRVGVEATATDLHKALLCGDASGFQALAQVGDPAPEGGAFGAFTECAFPLDGSVLFGATLPTSRQVYGAVYRATPAGIERIVGPGTVLGNGGVIDAVGDAPWSGFAANSNGTVVVKAYVSGGPAVVRARPGTAPDIVTLDLGGPVHLPIATYPTVDIDDRVYAVVGAPGDQALVVSDGEKTTVLTQLSNPQLPGGPLDSISGVYARGHRVLVIGDSGGRASRLLVYTPEGGFAPFLADQQPLFINAFGSERTLFTEIRGTLRPEFLLGADGVTSIGDTSEPFEPVALTVNNRVNVLFSTTQTPLGTGREVLTMSGPSPSGPPCFVPPTAAVTELLPPTPTPATCDTADCAHLVIGNVSGVPGERVTVPVTLDTGAWEISGIEADLAIAAAAPFAADDAGRPSCRVNPDIRKNSTAFAFEPAYCAGDSCTAIRAVVVGIDNLGPIANGSVLFDCDLSVGADTAPGQYVLTASNVDAADPVGATLSLFPTDGAVTVLAPRTAATGAVIGDCNGDGRVTIDELLIGVDMLLSTAPASACPAMECTTGNILISCLEQAVVHTLTDESR